MDGTSTPLIPLLGWYAVLASASHVVDIWPATVRHLTALEPAYTSTPLGEAAPIAVGQSNGKIWGEATTGNENNQGRKTHAC
jgi:hypothetical protein